MTKPRGKTLIEVFAAEDSTMKKDEMRKAFLEMAALSRGRNKGMNKTEKEFSWILEAQRREGKILRWEYEGMTLKWAGMRYTPDFVVFKQWHEGVAVYLIEVKGAHIWDRDIVRFKGCKDYWPEFEFEMWQKTKLGWKQKYRVN
jgi:hypothetical protein